ncbi:MAG: hypothetical protein IJW49_09405 [Clostridia bacterium]|nr:hypothetical protein [Clostridia bacterium]
MVNPMQFEVDYGRVPYTFLTRQRISNVCELLWSDEVCGLLRLCGAEEHKIGEVASDYERFSALCKALPMLKRHPIKQAVTDLLKTHFAVSEQPCDITWHTVAQALEERESAPTDFLPREPVSCLLSTIALPPLPSHISPMLDAEALLHASTNALETWREELRQTLLRFVRAGCHTVRFLLPASYTFTAPTVYHVQEALGMKKRTLETEHLLRSQLFRELCTICRDMSVRLLLHLSCAGEEAVALLRYAEECVGLPHLYWSADGRANDVLLRFQMQAHEAPVYWVLRLSDVPSDVELETVLACVAARYPITRLRFVCDCDLRLLPTARARLAEALQKTL